MAKWICTACEEAENIADFHCHLETPTDDKPDFCPVSRCLNKRAGYILGFVRFHPRWKEFEFLPEDGMGNVVNQIQNRLNDCEQRSYRAEEIQRQQKGECYI